MVRLFVRGLPDNNTSIQDVVARFASFGQVEACELVPSKQPETAGISKPSLVARPPWDAATPVANCRFAYVEMQPKDDSSLARCLSVYNHCKWRGHLLKVELAHPHYKQRLQAEWEAQAAAAEATASKDYVNEFAPAPMDVSGPLHITAPSHSRRRLKVLQVPLDKPPNAKGKKHSFPPVKEAPLSTLAWDYEDLPDSMVYRRNRDLEARNHARLNMQQQETAQHQPNSASHAVFDALHAPLSAPANGGAVAGEKPAEDAAGTKSTAAIPHTYAAKAPSQPQVLSREKHAYLKVIKAINSANAKQEMAEEAAAAAAAARARSQAQEAAAAVPGKAKAQAKAAAWKARVQQQQEQQQHHQQQHQEQQQAQQQSKQAAGVVEFGDDDGDGYAWGVAAPAAGGARMSLFDSSDEEGPDSADGDQGLVVQMRDGAAGKQGLQGGKIGKTGEHGQDVGSKGAKAKQQHRTALASTSPPPAAELLLPAAKAKQQHRTAPVSASPPPATGLATEAEDSDNEGGAQDVDGAAPLFGARPMPLEQCLGFSREGTGGGSSSNNLFGSLFDPRAKDGKQQQQQEDDQGLRQQQQQQQQQHKQQKKKANEHQTQQQQHHHHLHHHRQQPLVPLRASQQSGLDRFGGGSDSDEEVFVDLDSDDACGTPRSAPDSALPGQARRQEELGPPTQNQAQQQQPQYKHSLGPSLSTCKTLLSPSKQQQQQQQPAQVAATGQSSALQSQQKRKAAVHQVQQEVQEQQAFRNQAEGSHKEQQTPSKQGTRAEQQRVRAEQQGLKAEQQGVRAPQHAVGAEHRGLQPDLDRFGGSDSEVFLDVDSDSEPATPMHTHAKLGEDTAAHKQQQQQQQAKREERQQQQQQKQAEQTKHRETTQEAQQQEQKEGQQQLGAEQDWGSDGEEVFMDVEEGDGNQRQGFVHAAALEGGDVQKNGQQQLQQQQGAASRHKSQHQGAGSKRKSPQQGAGSGQNKSQRQAPGPHHVSRASKPTATPKAAATPTAAAPAIPFGQPPAASSATPTPHAAKKLKQIEQPSPKTAPPLTKAAPRFHPATLASAPVPVLQFATSFVRSKDANSPAAEAAWQSQRERLQADFKSRHRTALKHAAPKARQQRR